jgi:hypothetical protein
MGHLRGRTRWVLAVVAALAAVTFLVLPAGPRTVAGPAWRPAAPEVRGVYHIHTTRSDGTGTMDDVAAAAARAGLQFVIVTDHGDGTRRPDPPAYRHGVLCIDAVEISTDGGHYAALGLGQTPYPLAGEPRDVVEDVRRLGGFGIVTHPLSPKRGLSWQDWQAGFDGIEWLNGDSVWRDAPRFRLALAAWTFAFRPVASLTSLYARPLALDRADLVAGRRPVVFMAGVDAHARLGARDGRDPNRTSLFLRVPSYETSFEVASLGVRLTKPLTGDAASDGDAVVGAIRAGHVHTVVGGLARPGAFEFAASSGGVSAGEGDTLALGDAVTIRVRANVPPGGCIVLFHDGREIARASQEHLVYASNRRGVYRAEVWLEAPRETRPRPWIVGNPIYVGMPEASTATPAIDAGGPAFPVAFDGTSWAVEQGPGSRAALDRTAQDVTLRYGLGDREPPAPSAALVWHSSFDSRATGLAFVGRADRPMRISVQVRTSIGGEGRRWQRSVYLDETPREVMVAFGDMNSVAPGGAGPVPVRDLRALRFVVDNVNSLPGSSGQVTLEHVRFILQR